MNFIHKHKFNFALVLAFVIAASLAELVQPLWLQKIIDRSFLGGDWGALPIYAGLFFLFIALAQGLRFLESESIEKLSAQIAGELRARLWQRFAGAQTRAAQAKRPGEWTSLFCEEIATVHDYYVEGIASCVSQGLYLAGIFVFVAWLDPRMLLAFAFAPVLFLITIPLKNLTLKASRRSLESQESIYGFLEDVLRGRAEIRSFRMERAILGEARERFEAHRKTLLRQARLAALFPLVTESFGWLLTAAVLGIGGFQVLQGNLSIGTLVAFLEYSRRFFSPIREISERWNRFQTARAALRRLEEAEARLVPERRTGAQFPGLRRSVEFRDVTFGYEPDGSRVFENLNLAIEAGEKAALVGPSGVGKSTLLKLLLGLYEPERGTILLDGVSLTEWDLRSVRERGQATFSTKSSLSPFLLLDEIEKEMPAAELEKFLESVLASHGLTVLWVSHKPAIIQSFPRVIRLNPGGVRDDLKESHAKVH